MKKNLTIMITGIAAFIFSISACATYSTASSKEIREVSDFTKISLSISADVHLTQGKEFKVEVEADENDLDEILTEVSGNMLTIKTKNWHNNINRAVIYITMPEVEGLYVAGSGSIITRSTLNAANLDLNVSGSGSINLNELTVRVVDATITGSGNIDLNGKNQSEEINVNITGSGSYEGNGLSAGRVNVTITGSGSAKVNATENLTTNITGSGNVNYSGRPRVNASSTGSGKTRSMD